MTPSFETLAVFLGASPLGTALTFSLLLTLLILILARAAIRFGPALRQSLSKNRHYLNWRERLPSLRAELQIVGACLCVFVVSALGLAVVTEGVTENPLISQWDQQFVVTAHHALDPAEEMIFRTTTQLAGREASILMGVGLTLLFWWRGHRRLLTLWVAGLVGNSIIVQVLKQYYERPRPDFTTPFLTESNFSFPSGHAAASVLMYGLLAYLLLIQSEGWTVPLRLTLVTTVLWVGVFTGTSRLALGVHYPTDIVAGWLVAICWLMVLITADQFIRYRRLTI